LTTGDDRRHLAWTPPGGAFWAGSWRTTKATLAVHDPEDNALIGSVARTSASEVQIAVQALADEFATTCWPLWQRRSAIEKAAEMALARCETLARVMCRESSKTITEARAEVSRAVETLRLTARASGKLTGEEVAFGDSPRGTGRYGWFSREPLGVIAVISSFNDPLNLLVHKIGPALLAGNVVAIKPSEHTPLTALLLHEILLKVGIPPQRMSVLPGDMHTGKALVAHPAVQLITFTGGPETGGEIARQAGAKQTLMELGGNCPVIVCDDARLDEAAGRVAAGAFGAAGQNCISVQRVLVASGVYEEFLSLLSERTAKLSVGSKLSEATDIGPLISEAQAIRVDSWVQEAQRAGAELVIGGRRRGAFYDPTVLSRVPRGVRAWRSEIFGPVVCVNDVGSDDEAAAAANDTPYGLQAGIFTRDIDRAFTLARRLLVGAVMINDSSDYRLDSMPFGGPKGSSVGREGVSCTLRAMSQPKVIAFTVGS
jgi:glyceraldehyde-3-phosphate dehydrogenase (NADP+)